MGLGRDNLMAKFKGKNNQNSDLLISFNKDI
jgi:hypothetical protein